MTTSPEKPIPLCNGGLSKCRRRCRNIKPIPHTIDCYIGGAGMGAYYYTGVMYLLKCLEERRTVRIGSFHGSSSGAVASVAYLFDIDPDVWTQAYRFIQREFGRGRYLSHAYIRLLQRFEPDDALARVRGRLHIYATELSIGIGFDSFERPLGFCPQRCFSRFSSVTDLYQKIVASTSIPFVTIPTLATTLETSEGRRYYIDGMSIADSMSNPTNGRIRLRLQPPTTYPWVYRLVPRDESIHCLIQRGWDDARSIFRGGVLRKNTTITLPIRNEALVAQI